MSNIVMDEILILSAQPYSFKDEQNPLRTIQGISVHYITPNDVSTGSNDFFGCRVAKVTLPLETQLPSVPGIYLPEFKAVTTGKGVTLKIDKVQFINKVDLSNLVVEEPV